MQNTRVSQLGQLLQVGVQRRRVEQDGGLPGGLLEGLGQVLHHFSGILLEQRVVLHDQKLWWFSSRMVMSWKTVKARRTSSYCEVAIQSIEDAGVVAADKEDLVALQFQVAIEGAGHHIHWGAAGRAIWEAARRWMSKLPG
jgi:hypothetical protein